MHILPLSSMLLIDIQGDDKATGVSNITVNRLKQRMMLKPKRIKLTLERIDAVLRLRGYDSLLDTESHLNRLFRRNDPFGVRCPS